MMLSLFSATSIAARAGEAEVLILKSGDRLEGHSLGFDAGAILWELPHGAQMGIDLELVDRIEYPPLIAGDPAIAEEPIAEPVPPGGVFGPVYHRLDRSADWVFTETAVWTKRFEVGARFLDGNTDNDFVDLKTLMERDSPTKVGQIEAGGHFAQNSGDRIANRWFANGTIDFSRNGKWIVFVTAKNEYDEFKNLDYRGTWAAGPGYRFWYEKKKRLLVRVGPGFTYENFRDPHNERTTPDLLGELEARFPIGDFADFEHKTTINPSIDDFHVFRLNSTYGILLHLDEEKKWSLKLGLRHEYNSRPNPGRESSDYTSSVLLVYTRK